MQRSFRITATFLAALLLFLALAPALFAEAEPDSIGEAEVDPLLLLNGEAIIPEDFPNIFNSYNKIFDNKDKYLNDVHFIEILLNGRPLLLPVNNIENKIVPMFSNATMGTLSDDWSSFTLNENFFSKFGKLYDFQYNYFRDIRMLVDNLDIDINDPKLYQLKEYRAPLKTSNFL